MFSISKLFKRKPKPPKAKILSFDGQSIPLEENQLVLDALLDAGHSVRHGCRAGACQSCLMTCSEGSIPSAAQVGLNAAQKELNQFLSCSCIPSESMTIESAAQALPQTVAEVVEISKMNEQVVRVRLNAQLPYKSGQFVNVFKNGAVSRSYSLASTPQIDDFIELHIKRIEGGKFSQWAYDEMQIGVPLSVEGPIGACFYTADSPEQPLLLAGMGTGLAPLYGIVRDALMNHEHLAPIHLFVGAKDAKQLYLMDELKALVTQYPQLHVHYVVQQGAYEWLNTTHADSAFSEIDRYQLNEGDIYQYSKNLLPDCKGYRVFLCGADSFVRKMKKQCFLAGAAMSEISADTFLPSGH
ncbi:FAD-binding oxidoreductase [Echinimonas agarilytica]|uniref:2Fe-2S iron-sulfur cluster binding domain-containing protein n=1 Tax=Echinimonas agarilytica TaxID=1215918 RepID=A0AA41W6N2_9GAMM|nr:2Fe-2S iron-sulfur cluster binding domain-containing protein [Echinimonas agarilytica]MCM2680085.1 2Fe-2S iron-sulfur cluster binding domain-containing protein [Echinimonas agarilytica]